MLQTVLAAALLMSIKEQVCSIVRWVGRWAGRGWLAQGGADGTWVTRVLANVRTQEWLGQQVAGPLQTWQTA